MLKHRRKWSHLPSQSLSVDNPVIMNPKDSKPSGAAGLADPVLLDKIDKLFACNVGSYIDLPQLVAVGDQSSGKSSVLEGLTGLPFPRDSGLCTRFATQIIFKRSAKQSTSVSIIPSKEANGDHARKVSAWKKEGITTLDAQTFATIMREAQSVMGVGEPGITFSDDVLKLELSGPAREHLSIVDVPGIFRNVSENITTDADKSLVRAMVLRYMENPRSVILAVIPANVDTATQEILSMAKDVDADGQRTMGILTKPDLVDDGAEPQVIELMKGRKYRLALGWHIVRNLGQKHLGDSSVNRPELEKNFFKTQQPWNRLEKDAVGMPALEIRLKEVLNNHVKAEFPKVRSELNKRLKDRQALLQALGRRRESREDQAAYLTEMSSEFTDILNRALLTNYGSDVFDERPALKIPTLTVTKIDSFREMMHEQGYLYRFDCRKTSKSKGPSWQTRNVKTPADLEGLLTEPSEIAAPLETNIYAWLAHVYDTTRGFELGTFQASILPTTMREQSKKWSDIAFGFISDIASLVHTFILSLLEKVCPDKTVREALLYTLLPELLRRFKLAVDQVKFILFIERENTPVTTNKDFMEKLQGRRHNRLIDSVNKNEIDPETVVEEVMTKLNEVFKDMTMSNREQIVYEIHDITKSYYDIAVSRFIDTVCLQAAGHFLVNGPDTPLKLFSPRFVSGLTEEQLSGIAAEDPGTRRKRAGLIKEIEDLEAGRKVLFGV